MIAAVCMVKDEADIVGDTVSWMCSQVDLVIVADNGSTDATRDILEELPVVLVDDPEVGYYQSHKMSKLAAQARSEGADWVVPFDADELWLAREGRIADALEETPDEASIADAFLFDHIATVADPEVDSPVARMGWRRDQPAPLRKVAARTSLLGEPVVVKAGNHGAYYEGIDLPLTVAGQLQVRHFPYRSADQFVRRARNGSRAMQATDLGGEVCAHWRSYGRTIELQGEQALRDHFYAQRPRDRFWSPDPENDPDFLFDPVPRYCLSPL